MSVQFIRVVQLSTCPRKQSNVYLQARMRIRKRTALRPALPSQLFGIQNPVAKGCKMNETPQPRSTPPCMECLAESFDVLQVLRYGRKQELTSSTSTGTRNTSGGEDKDVRIKY